MKEREFFFKLFFILGLLSSSVFPVAFVEGNHNVDKRQIGVLARTGALPQGKRSLEVLARNGELPQLSGKRISSKDHVLDMLIEELESAENLSRLRAGVLMEKISQEKKGEEDPTSTATLAHDRDVPQKKSAGCGSRSGYLVRSPQETPSFSHEYFDSEDFLGTGKRTSVLGTNLFIGRKYAPSQADLYKNKNEIVRSSGSYTVKQPLSTYQQWVEDFESDNIHDYTKKNVGATKNFGKREIRINCLRDTEKSESYLDGAGQGKTPALGKRTPYKLFLDNYPDAAFPKDQVSYGSVEKRFLGRIPQLGRIHQKVQSPSMRRRPHLRPSGL